MPWPVKVYSLSSQQTDPGLFCSDDKLTLGGVSLLTRSDTGLEPRSLSELQDIFDDAYGADSTLDAATRLPCLHSIANALNRCDISHAAILSLMLRLPEIDEAGMARLKGSGDIASKYDENEARDRRGRWTAGDSQGAEVATTSTSQQNGTRITVRRPNGHQDNPNIVPTQLVIPIPPPIGPIPGVGAGRPKPDDDDVFPLPIPQGGTSTHTNGNADTGAQSTTDNQPEVCPDPSYEPTSKERTEDQLRYQAQISGLPRGFGVRLNGVNYDGCNPDNGNMLEAKTGTAWYIGLPEDEIRTLKEYAKIVGQATRQSNASSERLIEWHFSDPFLAYYWRKEFAALGFNKIQVLYTPYDELYNYKLNKRSLERLVRFL